MHRVLRVLLPMLAAAPAAAWEWDGAGWADYRPFLGPIDAAVKTNLQAIVAAGEVAGRVEGRMGQIGDSITESSAYFRNATLNGVSGNETGHDYVPVRSWLSYEGLLPPDANSFYRDHGKGPDYGNLGGWRISQAMAAGHPGHGVLTGDGVTPGQYSWVLLMFGTNDIDDGSWNVAAWKEDFRALVQGYAALGVVPVVSTIPPEQAHAGDGLVEAANQAIVELAGEELIAWVDFHGLVLHHQPANWVGTLIGNDGTHPTASTGGRGFSQAAQTSTDGYALRTKLTYDLAEKLKAIVWEDGDPDAATDTPVTAAGRPALRCSPNPFRGVTRIAGGGPVRILDVSGRVVRRLDDAGGEALWDGADTIGRPVPAGVYFVVRTTGGPHGIAKVVRLR